MWEKGRGARTPKSSGGLKNYALSGDPNIARLIGTTKSTAEDGLVSSTVGPVSGNKGPVSGRCKRQGF